MQLATAVGTAAPAGQGSVLGAFLPFAIVLGVMYFIVIRPQNVQRKKRDQVIASHRKGTGVDTIGGQFGEGVDIKDDALILNVSTGSEKVTVRTTKWAVQDVIGKDNAPKEKEQSQGQA